MAPVNFDLLLSTRLTISASTSTAREVVAESSRRRLSGKGLQLTREFAGGQFVVFVTKASASPTDFMSVQADDLLVSYAFAPSGTVQDKTIWDDAAPSLSTEKVYDMSALAMRSWAKGPHATSQVRVAVSLRGSQYLVRVGTETGCDSTTYRYDPIKNRLMN